MQVAMDGLTGFLERRSRLVIALWVVLLVAALPFAACLLYTSPSPRDRS